jgi:Tfp pilus assembly protein PilO
MSLMKHSDDVPKVSEIDGAGLAVLAGLTILFYFAALKPLLDRQRIEVSQARELEIQHAKADQLSQSLLSAREHLAMIQSAVADSPQKLEPVRALNDRLARITALATARGLDIADIRPGAVAASVHYTTVPISLVGAGGFPNCVRYLHQLHEQFGDTTVTALKLSGTPEDPNTPPAFQFELRWYAAPATHIMP